MYVTFLAAVPPDDQQLGGCGRLPQGVDCLACDNYLSDDYIRKPPGIVVDQFGQC